MFSVRFRRRVRVRRRRNDFCSSRQKPFKLNLRYLGQRTYSSGKMHWMTFWWPWPKVTTVTLINTNLLVWSYCSLALSHRFFFFFYFFSTYLFYFFSTWSWKIIPYLRFYFFSTRSWKIIPYFDCLVQDCSNSIANSLELLQSCTKPSKYGIIFQIQVEKNVNTE